MTTPVVTAEELREITQASLESPAGSSEELVDDWLYWFQKRGERALTTAAKFGYSSATLDLPFQLATKLERKAFQRLILEVTKLVPGSEVSLVEEDYEGSILYKLEVSWKPAQTLD